MTQSPPAVEKSHGNMDARKVRSRKALYAAFLQLLEQKALDQISIREIAAAAGIGHTTFYRHYATKEDLLNDLAADEIRRITNLALPVMDTQSTQAACLALCRDIIEKKKLWTILLTGGASSTVKEEWLNISRRVALDSDNTFPDRELLELEVILSVSAMLETLAWWLRQRQPAPPEQIAKILDRIIAMHSNLGGPEVSRT